MTTQEATIDDAVLHPSDLLGYKRASSCHPERSEGSPATAAGAHPAAPARPAARRLGYRFGKRAFDIAFSSVVIAIGFIPCAVLGIVVAANTKGSPIYTQERVGRNGKPFRLKKFRSMVADADNVEKYLNEEQLAQWRAERKVDEDPRITRLGRFLRRTSLDELPQFLNVWAGSMSIVGPRPITQDELHWFGDDVDLMLSVRGGITGWWQVMARNEASFLTGERQELEMEYVRNASARMDARVFFATFSTMLGRTGR